MLPVQQVLSVSDIRDVEYGAENRVGLTNVLLHFAADTTRSLFGLSALLMTIATASLAYLYGVVNGKEMNDIEGFANGTATKRMRSGNVKGE